MESNAIRTIETHPTKRSGTFSDYLTLARLDHFTKHIFIAPGFVLACLLRGVQTSPVALDIILGLLVAICIASANYVINEYLDRDFDRHHPTKSQRSAVRYELRGSVVFFEWLAFLTIGLLAALAASPTMFFIACVFALQGIVYNVPPLRMKDKAYLDVISEAINNPLRLMIGWVMVDPATLPPSSILLACWLGGRFPHGREALLGVSGGGRLAWA